MPGGLLYCSQRLGSAADVLKYTWLKPDEVLKSAEAGVSGGRQARMPGASGRGPNDSRHHRVSTPSRNSRREIPRSRSATASACSPTARPSACTRPAPRLQHNLNTAETNYEDICTTHSFADRAETVRKAKAAGLSPCSGLIAGMGETDEELVDVVFALRVLDPDSVPVNFPLPFEAVAAGRRVVPPPRSCAPMVVLPGRRGPAGRRPRDPPAQPAALALHIVNSIFLGDYLTSEGQPGGRDLEMIADAGFTVEGADERTLPGHRRDLVRLRRRGPGTALPANA